MFCDVRQSQPLMSWRVAFFGFVVALTGCGSVATLTQTRPSEAAPATRTGASVPGVRPQLVVLGEPVQPRRVEVMGVSGTVELRVEDPDAAAAVPLFVRLGRIVRREPRDVCFGTFTANESRGGRRSDGGGEIVALSQTEFSWLPSRSCTGVSVFAVFR